MKLLVKCLLIFSFIISFQKLEARAYNPSIENWRLIRSGYDKLMTDDCKGAIDDLTASLNQAQELSLDDSLNMIAASAFGLCLSCDRLDRMNEIYKEIGKKVVEYFLLVEDEEDLFDMSEDTVNELDFDFANILNRLNLSKNDLYQLETSCKDLRLKKLIQFVSSKTSY